MSRHISPARPLADLKRALRQCRRERQQMRTYAMRASSIESRAAQREIYPSLQPRASIPASAAPTSIFSGPTPGFRPSQAIKQNRFDTHHRKIRVIPAPRSLTKTCPDPISKVSSDQLSVLDPTGARTRLFSDSNPEKVQPGDILLVKLKSGDPFSGVVIDIRKRNSPIDTAILLRNNLTRVGVEMWYKVYSPNVEGIEIVQRKQKRARRAKLTYMRTPKHDRGSVENIVRAYQREKLGITSAKTARNSNVNLPKKKKKVQA